MKVIVLALLLMFGSGAVYATGLQEAPDGTWVGGTPSEAPDGSWVGN